MLIRLLQLVRPSATRRERDESFAASMVRTCHSANPASREAERNHFLDRYGTAGLGGLVLRHSKTSEMVRILAFAKVPGRDDTRAEVGNR